MQGLLKEVSDVTIVSMVMDIMMDILMDIMMMIGMIVEIAMLDAIAVTVVILMIVISAISIRVNCNCLILQFDRRVTWKANSKKRRKRICKKIIPKQKTKAITKTEIINPTIWQKLQNFVSKAKQNSKILKF